MESIIKSYAYIYKGSSKKKAPPIIFDEPVIKKNRINAPGDQAIIEPASYIVEYDSEKTE